MRTPLSPRKRAILILTSLTTAVVVLLGGAATAAVMTASYFFTGLGEDLSNNDQLASCGEGVDSVRTTGRMPSVATLSDENVRNAAIIIQVGQEMKIPPRGWVIAVATALQESYLRNLGHLGINNDYDSLGLFQQRPSMGWGTPDQVRTPKYAARKFYEKLVKVKGWQSMSLTWAAQTVQVSAFPEAYAKHEPLATQLVNTLANGAGRAAATADTPRCAGSGEVAASGWTIPAKGEIVSNFRTAERPNHFGTDLAVRRGDPIFATASGTVVQVLCNAEYPNGAAYGCNQDGGVNILGCGWYIDISHAQGVLTRYCHLTRPLVKNGQLVRAGEKIGEAGSTGNSSGVHLHFEVHTGGGGNAGAVDPVQFMRGKGAPLGKAS